MDTKANWERYAEGILDDPAIDESTLFLTLMTDNSMSSRIGRGDVICCTADLTKIDYGKFVVCRLDDELVTIRKLKRGTSKSNYRLSAINDDFGSEDVTEDESFSHVMAVALFRRDML